MGGEASAEPPMNPLHILPVRTDDAAGNMAADFLLLHGNGVREPSRMLGPARFDINRFPGIHEVHLRRVQLPARRERDSALSVSFVGLPLRLFFG